MGWWSLASSSSSPGNSDASNSGHPILYNAHLESTLPNGQCQLTYARFHLQWTIPPCLLLYLLARPFLTRLDRVKLFFLPTIALVWTTAWDSQLIRRGAWTYPRSCVLGTVLYVPWEEYFFIAIQSIIITLLTTLCTRWLFLPSYLFRPSLPGKSRAAYISGTPFALAILLTAFFAGVELLWYEKRTYYIGMILWWASVPLALLLGASVDFIGRIFIGQRSEQAEEGEGEGEAQRRGRWNWLALLAPVVLPTVYLWTSDVYAMRRKTWHITERTSLQIFFPLPDLPIEEALFFLVTNLILISASLTFDRVLTICRFAPEKIAGKGKGKEGVAKEGKVEEREQPPYSTTYLPLDTQSISALWRAFLASDIPDEDVHHQQSSTSASPSSSNASRQEQRIRDLERSMAVLSGASRSFTAASYLLPWDLRADLCSLYAFCRASDNLIDEKAGVETEAGQETEKGEEGASDEQKFGAKRKRLEGLWKLLDLAYSSSSTSSSGREEAEQRIQAQIDSMCKMEGLSMIATPTSSSAAVANATRKAYQDLADVSGTLLDFNQILPRRLWEELFQGYEMDVAMEEQQETLQRQRKQQAANSQGRGGKVVALGTLQTMEELERYGQCVAGSIGEMCTRVVLHRAGHLVGPPESQMPSEKKSVGSNGRQEQQEQQGEQRWSSVIQSARRMGVALQFVNIARDVDADLKTLKRCYLPTEMIGDDLIGLIEKELAEEGDEDGEQNQNRKQPSYPTALRPHAIKILDIAAEMYQGAYPAIQRIPVPAARSGLRVACAVYADIASAIRRQGDAQIMDGERAVNTTRRRIWVAIKALYF